MMDISNDDTQKIIATAQLASEAAAKAMARIIEFAPIEYRSAVAALTLALVENNIKIIKSGGPDMEAILKPLVEQLGIKLKTGPERG